MPQPQNQACKRAVLWLWHSFSGKAALKSSSAAIGRSSYLTPGVEVWNQSENRKEGYAKKRKQSYGACSRAQIIPFEGIRAATSGYIGDLEVMKGQNT